MTVGSRCAKGSAAPHGGCIWQHYLRISIYWLLLSLTFLPGLTCWIEIFASSDSLLRIIIHTDYFMQMILWLKNIFRKNIHQKEECRFLDGGGNRQTPNSSYRLVLGANPKPAVMLKWEFFLFTILLLQSGVCFYKQSGSGRVKDHSKTGLPIFSLI